MDTLEEMLCRFWPFLMVAAVLMGAIGLATDGHTVTERAHKKFLADHHCTLLSVTRDDYSLERDTHVYACDNDEIHIW